MGRGVSKSFLAGSILLLVSLAFFSRNGAVQAADASPSLSCESAYRMGEWSWSKTPSEKPSDLKQAEFARKVLRRYIEMADPNRLFFLESETKAFADGAEANWRAFVERKDCSAFESWFTAAYQVGKRRLERLMAKLPLDKTVPAVLPKHEGTEKNYPYFSGFSSDEAELSRRVLKYAKILGETTSQTQLAAFNGDKAAMVRFGLGRAIFSEPAPAPVHLLARAFVSSLDPFSDYFSETEYADFYRDLTGGTSGVGVRVRDVPQGLLVQRVVPDSPAGDSKQIQAGDTITHVDTASLAGWSAQKLRHALEGPEFSPVVLTVARPGSATRKVRLVRRSFAFEDERVELRQVGLRSRSGTKVAVISIPSFYGRGGSGLVGERSSAEDVEVALVKAMRSKPSAVVLDMRGNPGGYLEEAVAMGGLFLGNRPVVAVVEPTMQRIMRDYHARAVYNGPLLVLVDDQSASAAEVLAGALKDYQRAVVLGAPRTFGKGSVQRLFHLDTGLVALDEKDRQGVLKLTTSFFYSPLGHSPASVGITPHILLASPNKDDDGDEKPRRLQVAPAHGPFVDGALLSSIQLQEGVMQERIAALKQSNAVRASDVKEIFEEAVAQAFGPRKTDEPARASLVETLAIAQDWIGMEQTSPRSGRALRHGAETSLRR